MKNSARIKVFFGIICFLLVLMGVVWFFVYQQYQNNREHRSQALEAAVATPASEVQEKVIGEEAKGENTEGPEVAPTKMPKSDFDSSRLGNPSGPNIVTTDLSNKLGITKENYPRIDSSTSTFGLVQGLYWVMFEYTDYEADYEADYEVDFEEDFGLPKAPAKTIPSYKNLIAGDVDLIIVPDPSQEVKDLEKEAGVELEYIPIGVEGLVFITPKENPVSNITREQANQIYVDRLITNWAQLGGEDGNIIALCRNSDSGSQAQFDNLVIEEGKEINQELKEKYTLDYMHQMLAAVSGDDKFMIDNKPVASGNNFPLGYSIYYYIQGYEDDGVAENIKMLTINDIAPSPESIASKEYPLAVSYFAVIRKNTPQGAPARVIANWLTTEEGQEEVENAGLGKIVNN